MKTTILDHKCNSNHARGAPCRTAALLGGLVLALTLPGTCLKAQTLGVDSSVLLTWPEPAQEQIVVGSDSPSGPVWTPWPEPIFKRCGQMCMVVPTTASGKFFRTVPGRQFVDDFSDTKLPYTNRGPWTEVFKSSGEEWAVTNGVLRVDWNAPGMPGFALVPLGTNVAGHLRDVNTSVDLLDCVTSGTNGSVLTLVVRGRMTGPNSGNGYFGGLSLNHDGIAGVVQPWIFDGLNYTDGETFNTQQFPLPYRLQFSVVGSRISFQVLSLTMGQLIRQVGTTNSAFPTGFAGLWINGRNNAGDRFTITADNFFMSATKP